MENVWAYLRKSRDETDDPHILDKHRSELLRLAAYDGVPIPPEQVFAEIGSADHIDSRPVFRRLLGVWERLPRNAGGVIYSTEVSRLTRGLQSQQGRVQDALARAALRHRTRSRWYDLRVPDDCTAWELEGFIARMENRAFKARVMAAWEEMLRQGRPRGNQGAYGYRWSRDARNLVTEEPQFSILQRCCQEVLLTGVDELAKRYGIPRSTLHGALRHPLICGYPARRYALTDDGDWRLRPQAEWDWPEVQNNTYPHACTHAEWEAIQAVLTERRDCDNRTNYENGWCRNLVSFTNDPGPCRLASLGSVATGRAHYLTYERRVGNARPLYIARESVHEAVEAFLQAFFGDPTLLPRLKAVSAAHTPRAVPDLPEAGDLLRERLVLVRRRYQEAVDAEMDAEEPLHRRALGDRRLRLERELGSLQAQLEVPPAAPTPAQQLYALLADTPGLGRHFPAVWGELQGAARRQLVEVVLCEIQVTVTPGPRPHQREVTALRYHEGIGENSMGERRE